MFERQIGKTLGLSSGLILGVDELEFITARLRKRRITLRADAEPVDPGRCRDRTVALDADLETTRVQRLYRGLIELQQGLAARADDIAALASRPCRRHGIGEVIGARKLATARPVGADKIGVAETTYRVGTVLLTPGPEIAAGESKEHGRPAGLRTLALQRVVDFPDRVRHSSESSGSSMPAWANPRARRMHAGHSPHGGRLPL